MRDSAISLPRINELHPKLRQEIITGIDYLEAQNSNMTIRVAQGYRSFAYQDDLYAQGRTKPGQKVTQARGGQSDHNFRVAWDFVIIYNGKEVSWDVNADRDKDGIKDYFEVIEYFESKGWSSGARWRTFKDCPHLAKTFGRTTKQLLAMYKAKKFIQGTEFLEL